MKSPSDYIYLLEFKNGGNLIYGESLSHSDKEKIYVVTIDIRKGLARCTCPAGSYGNQCKHLEGLLDKLEEEDEYEPKELLMKILLRGGEEWKR